MVTKDMLDQLRQQRNRPNARLEYNIGGMTQINVVSSVDAMREGKIMRGERTLQDALLAMRREQTFASRVG